MTESSQCGAQWEYANGQTGAYGCSKFNCFLKKGHDGNHRDFEGFEWQRDGQVFNNQSHADFFVKRST